MKGPVNKVDRFNRILEELGRDGSTTVEGLAQLLGVSPATVRRDLQELEDHRLLARTHGGAVAHGLSYELPIRYRTTRSEEKRRIGAAAAKLVPPGSVVGVTGGTTTTEAARSLTAPDLTIVTNALNIAAELAVRPDLRLVVTGGVARSASFELVGPIAEQMLEHYNIDVALLGADGVDVRAGASTHDDIEARCNFALAARSHRRFLLVDSSKLGRVAFARICGLDSIDILITDTGADPAQVEDFKRAGVEVQLA